MGDTDMDREQEIKAKLMENNPEFKSLVEQHQDYEKILDDMAQRPYLSPEDDLERKRLQKEKLAVKDRIASLVADNK